MKKIDYAIYPTLLDEWEWYLKSEDEDAKQRLLDKINRVPKEKTFEQMRGILFNKLVDNERVSIEEIRKYNLDKNVVEKITDEIKYYLFGAPRQVYAETIVKHLDMDVKLYGIIDAVDFDTIYDIKTTKSYDDVGKYFGKYQHLVYLKCLEKRGIHRFQYIITDFKRVYKEQYKLDADAGYRLYTGIASFICFLEDNRELITDKKIFGG